MIKGTVPGSYYFILFLIGIFLIISLVRTFQALKAYRDSKNTPTSKIRSAAQGFVELQGKQVAIEDQPCLSPLSFMPCTWYRYIIEEWVQREKSGSWELRHEESSSLPFLIQDDTGQCWVFPKEADFITDKTQVKYSSNGIPWYRNHDPHHKPGAWERFWVILSTIVVALLVRQTYRHREWFMSPGDFFYGLGLFRTHYPGKIAELQPLLQEAQQPALFAHNVRILKTADTLTQVPLNTLSHGTPNDPCTFLIANVPQNTIIIRERIRIGMLLLTDLVLLGGLVWLLTSS